MIPSIPVTLMSMLCKENDISLTFCFSETLRIDANIINKSHIHKEATLQKFHHGCEYLFAFLFIHL